MTVLGTGVLVCLHLLLHGRISCIARQARSVAMKLTNDNRADWDDCVLDRFWRYGSSYPADALVLRATDDLAANVAAAIVFLSNPPSPHVWALASVG